MNYRLPLGMLAVLAGVALAGPGVREARRTIGNASFAVPPGWAVRDGDASDHVSVTKADSKRYCILSVFAPRNVDPDPNAEFAAEWNNVLQKVGPAPKPTTRMLGTLAVREAGVQAVIDGTAAYAGAHLVEIDREIVTVISYSPDAKALAWCRADLDVILRSVRISAPPPSDATPAPPSDAPPSGPQATTLRIADLVGKWGNNGASTLSYVDANGNYAGSSTAFFGEWYTFSADGRYTFSFQGRASQHTVRETGAGKVTLAGDLLTLDGTREGTHTTLTLRLLGFQPAKDGTAVLLLLDAQYPATAGNIGLYKQAWIREPTKKK